MIDEEKIIEAAVKYNVENYSQIDNDFQNALNITSVKSFVAGAKWAINLKEDLKEKIMNTDYVTLEIAKKLEEKGFNCETEQKYERNIFACRYKDYPKPTVSQVMKWLREEKNIHIEISIINHDGRILWTWCIYDIESGDIRPYDGSAESFEKATFAGIEYVLENLI